MFFFIDGLTNYYRKQYGWDFTRFSNSWIKERIELTLEAGMDPDYFQNHCLVCPAYDEHSFNQTIQRKFSLIQRPMDVIEGKYEAEDKLEVANLFFSLTNAGFNTGICFETPSPKHYFSSEKQEYTPIKIIDEMLEKRLAMGVVNDSVA